MWFGVILNPNSNPWLQHTHTHLNLQDKTSPCSFSSLNEDKWCLWQNSEQVTHLLQVYLWKKEILIVSLTAFKALISLNRLQTFSRVKWCMYKPAGGASSFSSLAAERNGIYYHKLQFILGGKLITAAIVSKSKRTQKYIPQS